MRSEGYWEVQCYAEPNAIFHATTVYFGRLKGSCHQHFTYHIPKVSSRHIYIPVLYCQPLVKGTRVPIPQYWHPAPRTCFPIPGYQSRAERNYVPFQGYQPLAGRKYSPIPYCELAGHQHTFGYPPRVSQHHLDGRCSPQCPLSVEISPCQQTKQLRTCLDLLASSLAIKHVVSK